MLGRWLGLLASLTLFALCLPRFDHSCEDVLSGRDCWLWLGSVVADKGSNHLYVLLFNTALIITINSFLL